jgi:hypothetical protein
MSLMLGGQSEVKPVQPTRYKAKNGDRALLTATMRRWIKPILVGVQETT